jgi:hypothetical protein
VTTGPKNEGEVGIFDYRDPSDLKLVWQGKIDGMGDYAHFQNGVMYGSKISSRNWIKWDFEKRQTMQTGTTGDVASSRYVVPLGNMLWVGDPDGNDGNNIALIAHAQEPDKQGPKVLFAHPLDGEKGLPVTSRIGLALDEEIDNRSASVASFTVSPVGGAPLEGTYTHGMGILNFTPRVPLLPGTTYEVVVPANGLKDPSGNGAPVAYASKFTTKGISASLMAQKIVSKKRRVHLGLELTSSETYRNIDGRSPLRLPKSP